MIKLHSSASSLCNIVFADGRLDKSRPVELGNIVCLTNFLGGVDEEWFRLVHVEIEARAAPALANLVPGQASIDAPCAYLFVSYSVMPNSKCT